MFMWYTLMNQNSSCLTGRVVRLSLHEVDFSSMSRAKHIHSFNRPFLKAQMHDIFSVITVHTISSILGIQMFMRDITGSFSAPISEPSFKNVECIVHARPKLIVEKIWAGYKERRGRGCDEMVAVLQY